MKFYLFMIIASLFYACNSDYGNMCCFVVDTDVNITLRDSAGNDLLNPINPGAYDQSAIRVFSDPNADMNNGPGYRITTGPDKENVIEIFPYEDQSTSVSTTYIEYQNQDVDTIQCEFQRTETMDVCTKVWYNGQLKWKSGTGRYFEIVKK